MADPFDVLGLSAEADADDVRDARRRLAREHHPDRGGDPARMRAVNEAADAALVELGRRGESPAEVRPHEDGAGGSPGRPRSEREPTRVARDVPSFTVEALPAETFEALLIVAAVLGDVLEDDPPYRLDVYLRPPLDCWCRLDVLPDAGSSTVSLTVAGIDAVAPPALHVVRDAWVSELNALDWPS